jgi:hypothetical protein
MRLSILCLLLLLGGCVVSRSNAVTVEEGRSAMRQVPLPAGAWTIYGPHDTYDFMVIDKTARMADGESLGVLTSDRAEFDAMLAGVKDLPVSRVSARYIELLETDVTRLAAMTSLRELELFGVTIADPACLAPLAGRVEITVMPAASGAAELERLSASPAITGLYISGTQLAHWAEILKFSGLRRLSVTSTTGTSAEYLAKLSPLTTLARLELWLYRSDALPALGEALGKLPALDDLALNLVGTWALSTLKLPAKLRRLSLRSARLDQPTLKLIAGLDKLQELEAISPQVTDGDDLELLGALTGLRRLSWNSGEGYDGRDFDWLKDCPQLEVADFSFANVSSLTLRPLRPLARLKVVDLRYTVVDPDAVDRADFAAKPIIIYDRPTSTEVNTIFEFK